MDEHAPLQSQAQPRKGTMPWAWIKAVNDILSEGPFDEPEELPVSIQPPWLWLSGQSELSRMGKLQELGITHVLTTNKLWSYEELEKLRNRLKKGAGIEHCAVPGLDEPGYEMLAKNWGKCRAFLTQAREDPNNKVIVHCAAGQNRSALIAGAALVAIERMHLLDAVKILKAKRGIVLINESFQRQLCLLAAEERLLGETPEGYTDEPPAAHDFIIDIDDRWG